MIVSRDQLCQLLRQTLGSEVELGEYRIGNQHHDYLVLLVQLHYPVIEVVVKLAGPEAPLACPFDRTAALHRLVAARTAIPMPEVLAVDVSYNLWPWRYFIKAHIPGEEWVTARERMNAEELADAYRQLGNAVAQLHSIRFAGFGELSAAGEAVEGVPFLSALAERAQSFIKSARLRVLFLSVLGQHENLFQDIHTPNLCHEDLHQHNILFHDQQGKWRLATILDFDKAWAGHRETDLARMAFWRGMTSREFWQAYEAICPIEPLFAQRRLIYQLLWCFEYARSTSEHLADTQRLCAALGLSCRVDSDFYH